MAVSTSEPEWRCYCRSSPFSPRTSHLVNSRLTSGLREWPGRPSLSLILFVLESAGSMSGRLWHPDLNSISHPTLRSLTHTLLLPPSSSLFRVCPHPGGLTHQIDPPSFPLFSMLTITLLSLLKASHVMCDLSRLSDTLYFCLHL